MSVVDVETTDFPSFPELLLANLPAEDRVAFGSLPPSELRAWMDARDNEYRRRINELETYSATIRSLRNACAPVSRLPNEILMDIFADSSLTRHTHVRRVCRKWRSVLLETSPFWVNCITDRPLHPDPHDRTFLKAALDRSGTQPLSIELSDPLAAVWNALLEHRTRINELTVTKCNHSGDISSGVDRLFSSGRMEQLCRLKLESNARGPFRYKTSRPTWDEAMLPALHTLQISRGAMSPSMVVASLVTLELDNVWITSTMLIDIVNKCPSLETVMLGCRTLIRERDDDFNTGEAICLSQLRSVTIDGTPHDVGRVLRLFRSIPTHTLVTLLCRNVYGFDRVPAIDFQRVFAPPLMDRVCIDHSARGGIGAILARAYCDVGERLRIECQNWEFRAVEPLLPPVSVGVVNLLHDDWDLLDWRLPRLRRLEVSHTGTSVNKTKSVARFLHRKKEIASELSLAWVLPVDPEQEAQSLAEAELKGLLDVLRRAHVRNGDRALGKLELHAVAVHRDWEPFTGSIVVGSDTLLCSKIVEPFLARLQDWVDHQERATIGARSCRAVRVCTALDRKVAFCPAL